jgi:hypothetical protein
VPLLISFIDVGFLINNLSTNQKEYVMKNLFLTSMVLFLVFIFGCQESTITDPTQPLAEDQDAQVNNKDLFQDKPDDVNHNIISLKYELSDPGSPDATQLTQLTGQVSYFNTIMQPITDDGKIWVKVRLEMVALLSRSSESDHPPRWMIEKKTEDKVFFTSTGSAAKELSKTYSITNRDDVKLFVTYLVTSKTVTISSVLLRRHRFQAIDID